MTYTCTKQKQKRPVELDSVELEGSEVFKSKKMPRKRHYKDPVIQKIDFDEAADEATTTGSSLNSEQIPKSAKNPQNLGGVSGPEADGPPTAPEQSGYAELIPTDFAHRDRLRFSWPGGLAKDDGSPNRFLVSCVCLICLILAVQWIKTEGYNLCLRWYLELWDGEEVEKNQENNTIYFFGLSLGFLGSLLISFLLGLSCLLFSWGITYQDSLQPGQLPPSPLSPQKIRKQSGHTFHSGYVMAIINGIAVFTLSVWWLCT